jgi:DNA-directed RNA polymerase specialized sigma24 family protein
MSVVDEPSSAQCAGRRGFSSDAVSPEWGALMAEAQAGNSTAYRKMLLGLARWLEHFYLDRLPPEAVDDGIAGALRLIHELRHTYDPTRPFDPWLISIAQHQCRKIRNARGIRARATATAI